MNTVTCLTLNSLPKYNDSNIVTTTPDGKPLSYVYDEEWDFSGMEKPGIDKKTTLSFKMLDKEHRKYIQSTLAFTIEHEKRVNKIYPTRSSLKQFKNSLHIIIKLFKLNDWAELSDDKLYKRFKSKFEKYVQTHKFSGAYCDKVASALNRLNRIGLCARTVNSREYRSFSVSKVQQHIAIPIRMYQTLIAQAIETIETYHEYRSEISQLEKLNLDIQKEEENRASASDTRSAVEQRIRARIKKISHKIPHYTPDRTGVQVGRIMRACAVVILAFSGMRLSEMLSLSSSSYKERGMDRIPILQGEERKRNGRIIQETWQTHSITKDALELLYDITQPLRNFYTEKNNNNFELGLINKVAYENATRQINSAFLVLNATTQSKMYVQTNLARQLGNYLIKSGVVATSQDVDEFNRLNPSRTGQLKVSGPLPKLTSHDFRRSFAVFFKRYGFGSSSTIKFQYKHTNIQMSDYYSNNARLQAMEDVLLDKQLLDLMNEEGIQLGVDIYDEIYNDSEYLSGVEGERIAQDKFAKLNSGQHVYMTRTEIERLVRAGTLSVVKLPTGGYCTNPTCSRICGIGEFETEINPCSYKVVTDKEAKNILRQNKRLIQKFRALNTGDTMMNSILIATKQKIKRNELLIKKHHLNFEEFNDKVQGITMVETS